MMSERPASRLGLVASLTLLISAAALLGSGASAANQRAVANVDMRGVWNAPSQAGSATYPQQWHVTTENLASGAFAGTDVGGGASFAISGVVSGNHLTVAISGGGYTSHGQATISGSHGSGTFTDTNGTHGTFTLSRLSGPPTSTLPPNPDQAKACVGSCADGTNVTYDPTLDPGQTSDTTTASCSSSRATASATFTAAALSGCLIDAVIKTVGEPLSDSVKQIIDKALDQGTSGLIAGGGLLDGVIKATSGVGPILTPEQSQQIEQQFQQWYDENLQNSSDPATPPALELADTTLAPDFPPADRGTASARSAQLNVSPMPSPTLVLQSIAAAHPSAAAIAAFKSAMKLATAPTYSPARGAARVTLILAVALGQRTLAYDLRGKHGAVVLAHVKTTVQVHHKKKLTLTATALGGRVLRMLEVVGLSHKTSIQLKVSSNDKGKTAHATRSIRVR